MTEHYHEVLEVKSNVPFSSSRPGQQWVVYQSDYVQYGQEPKLAELEYDVVGQDRRYILEEVPLNLCLFLQPSNRLPALANIESWYQEDKDAEEEGKHKSFELAECIRSEASLLCGKVDSHHA